MAVFALELPERRGVEVEALNADPDLVGPQLPARVESLGRLLFTDFLFPFELTSVLLLAAMIGVLLLARRRPS